MKHFDSFNLLYPSLTLTESLVDHFILKFKNNHEWHQLATRGHCGTGSLLLKSRLLCFPQIRLSKWGFWTSTLLYLLLSHTTRVGKGLNCYYFILLFYKEESVSFTFSSALSYCKKLKYNVDKNLGSRIRLARTLIPINPVWVVWV